MLEYINGGDKSTDPFKKGTCSVTHPFRASQAHTTGWITVPEERPYTSRSSSDPPTCGSITANPRLDEHKKQGFQWRRLDGGQASKTETIDLTAASPKSEDDSPGSMDI